mgnify:CR=1 FL=1
MTWRAGKFVSQDFHHALKLAFGAAGHLLFQGFCRQRTDGDLEFFLHILGNAAVKGVACHRHAGGFYTATHADDGNVGGSAADVHDHAAVGFANLQTGTQGSGNRLVHQKDLLGPGPHDRLDHGVSLDAGNLRGHADRDAGFEDAGTADLVDKADDELIGHAMVLDDAIPQGAHKVDIGGRTAHHLQGFVPHRNDGIGASIHRADGRLAEDDALFFGSYDNGSSSQINTDVILLHLRFSVDFCRDFGSSSVAATAAAVIS